MDNACDDVRRHKHEDICRYNILEGTFLIVSIFTSSPYITKIANIFSTKLTYDGKSDNDDEYSIKYRIPTRYKHVIPFSTYLSPRWSHGIFIRKIQFSLQFDAPTVWERFWI